MFDPVARQPIQVVFPAEGVFVLESHHSRAFRMADTRHDFLKLVCVFAGAGWLVRGGGREPLRAGSLAVIPAGVAHRIEDAGAQPLSLYAVCVRRDFLGASAGEWKHYRLARPQPLAAEARGLIRRLLHEQTLRRTGSGALLRGLAWQLLGLVQRGAPAGRAEEKPGRALPARARVAAYARDLEQTFYQAETLDGAAAKLGLSRRRFTQLFREVTGASWLGQVRRLRLAHARRLLGETGRSVTSIGFECGFEDLSNFYRTFKAAENRSPAAWRAGGRAR